MNRLEAKDGEDDRAGVDGREGIAGGDDDHVLDAVLGGVVVAAKAYDRAKGKAKGVKDLKDCAVETQRGKTLSVLHHCALFQRFASTNQHDLSAERF